MRGRSGRIKRKTGTAGLINSYGDDMQPGDVVHSARTTAPAGYLIANGAAVSRTVYGNLFSALGTLYGAGDGATTFNVPDLRGEFIRGADQGRGVDSNRNVGSWQADDFRRHLHGLGSENAGTGVNLIGDAYDQGSAGNYPAGTGTGYAGGNETRPRNLALLPLIKY